MTYTKDLDKYTEHKELFERIMALKVGGSIKQHYQTRAGANRGRHLIYGWLKYNHLKSRFRLRWPSDTTVVVERLDTHPIEEDSHPDELTPRLEKILREMLVAEDGEATKIALRQKEAGAITIAEVGLLTCKYYEVMGGTE